MIQRLCHSVASVLAGGLSTEPITAKALSLCTFDGETPHLQEGRAMFYVDEGLLPVLCVCCSKSSVLKYFKSGGYKFYEEE